ncbi:MAG: ATP-binding cassette domain-containing protein [Candidatus Sericytochromatia bacterium]|nr:ATP-binding cassette domain-containing protein [Candidatus Sericytochromatia bacterium]
MTVLEITQLSKRYGKLQALQELSLQVRQGNIYGLLGPNGSGKTTTLGIILGVIRASGGSYRWFDGQQPEHLARRRVGVLLETPNFYPYLSAVKNLEVVAAIKGLGRERIQTVLEQVNLWERRDTPFRTYSLGMRQRLAVAAALLSDPDILVLDEPTNGLDPQGIADMRQIIQAIGASGKTILLASHILDEVEKICTQVAVIKRGKLLAAGDIEDVLRAENRLLIGASDLAAVQRCLEQHPQVQRIQPQGALLEVIVDENLASEALNRFVFEQGLSLSHLQQQRKGLEATFLELTADDEHTA